MQNLPEGEVLAIPSGRDTITLLLQCGEDMPHLLWFARKHYKEGSNGTFNSLRSAM